MSSNQQSKATTFRELHRRDGIFVMPNAWNAGSAVLLEMAGFEAIGTTSAGIAYSMGLPDYQAAMSREEALLETRKIASAVDVPVSADAENGYGHAPEEVAETIGLLANNGAVGANIEDYSGDSERGMYSLELGVERIRAAREAADDLDLDFTLTARAECYLLGMENAFAESVRRVNAYREAGADCLFVPGVKDKETIAALVREVDGPVNVVMGLVGAPMSVNELEDLGVRRVSIGGSLARATFGFVRKAVAEIRDHGSFGYAAQQIPDAELTRIFSDRMAR